MKRAKGIGWLCILPLIVLLAIMPEAQCLESGTSEINFPTDKSLGTVNIEVNQDHPPYFASVKPPLGKAQGTLKYPAGSKLQVIASYAVVENPALLAGLNHKDIVALQFTSLPVDAAFVGRLKGFKYLRKLRLDETDLDDTVFKELAAISGLEDINLSKTMVKGDGLKNLAALKRLNTLNLNHDQLNPLFCRQLSALTALRCLDLANCGIDDS
ncbi:MAG: hypothetical protein JSS83_27320 [Cyanobacteria bacterium SZAS LIN-3]|nr:hypothetical protein [Cyanobacteria bacterium SZAS LIN-3]